MKRILFFVLMLILMAGTSTAKGVSDPVPIKLDLKTNGTSSNAPRSQVPICASVDDETGLLSITFLYDIGMVDVEVWETTTSAYASQYYDSADGYAQMLLPAAAGEFLVIFTTSDGDVYEGGFSI